MGVCVAYVFSSVLHFVLKNLFEARRIFCWSCINYISRSNCFISTPQSYFKAARAMTSHVIYIMLYVSISSKSESMINRGHYIYIYTPT